MKKQLLTGALLCLSVFGMAQTTLTYNYTGAVQTYTVPACVTSITVQLYGAQGGNAAVGGTGGLGGYVTGTLAVTPGDVLNIYVGGQNGYNGGGTGGQDGNNTFGGLPGNLAASGGGASDIRLNGTLVTDRVAVAGGGGGAGSNGVWPGCQVAGPAGNGGNGGGLTGGTGGFGVGTPCNCGGGGGDGGQGGTQSAGGVHGGYYGNTACLRSNWAPGADGTLAQGGAGSLIYYNGTGGGGGYYGGGAGANGSDTTPGGGGGGGSSWTGVLTGASTTAGARSGNGMVVITIPPSGSPPAAPTSIAGQPTLCEGAYNTFAISAVAGATSYTWSVPAGTTITNGQGTVQITVQAGSTSGNVTVTADNACGSSAPATFALTINPSPSVTATAASGTICDGSSDVLTASGASSYSWSSGGTNATETVSPNASTSYTVTGTDANGCSNVATVSVTVNPLPVVTAAASASSICAGTNDTLTASGASTYSWSTGGSSAVEIIAPSSSQTVTVTGTDANGCANTATATISVNPLPAVTISTSASSICTGDSVTMVASGANSYSWSSGGSNASEVIYPSATGSYTVTGTDVNGCVNTATVAVTVNANPVVTISADVQSGCAPLCVNFASTGSPSCVNSLWSFDDASTDNSENPTHCFVSGGNYSVVYTCTDANGCSSQMSMLITANQPPVASLTATATSACLSDGAIILSGTPAGGTYSGPGVTGASFSPSSAGTGTHSVVYSYTDANGCSDTAMIAITVNACTGIADLAAPGAVNLFPNPNNGAFTLQVNMSAPELIIEVTDLQGRIVFISQEQHIAPGFLRQVVLGDVAPGMYLVKLTSGNQHSVQQISIQK